MKKLILALVFLSVIPAMAQTDSVSLDFCWKSAAEKYPLLKQKDLLNESSELKIKNIGADYLPSVSVNGQATYQSDVTSVSLVMPTIPGIGQIPSPDMPVPGKDQYKASIDISQPIWDGGITRSRKEIEAASLDMELQNIEVDMYKLWPQISNLYFSVLIYDKNIEILNLLAEELDDKMKVVESGLKNGVADSVSLEIIQAEVLNVEKQLLELKDGRRTSINMLNTIAYTDINENTVFTIPNPVELSSGGTRPELKVFELSRAQLAMSEKLVSGKSSPKVYGFGQVGYGKPGLNMLSDEFDSFWIVGAKVSWSISDLKKNSREKQILKINSEIINTKEEVFRNAIEVESVKNNTELEKYNSLVEKSNEIYVLRESIAGKSSSKFKNGVFSANDLITDINAKTRAKLNLEFYKLQAIKAELDFLITNGNINISNNENTK